MTALEEENRALLAKVDEQALEIGKLKARIDALRRAMLDARARTSAALLNDLTHDNVKTRRFT